MPETVEFSSETITQAVLALERIEAVGGRRIKEEVLKEHQSNPVLLLLLRMTLGDAVYYLTVKEDPRSAGSFYDLPSALRLFVQLTDRLAARELSGNAAKAAVSQFLSECHPRLRKWLLRTLQRDLRIGVGKSVVDELFGKEFLRPEREHQRGWFYYGCMLAKPYEDVYTKGKEPSFPLGVEAKLDGERANLFAFPADNKLVCQARGGKGKDEIESVPEYITQVLEFSRKLAEKYGIDPNTPMYLDGEFLASDWNSTASVVSRTENFDPADFLTRVRTVLWDWMPLADYQKQEFSFPWVRRKALLMLAAGLERPTLKFTKVSSNLYVLGHALVHNAEELAALYANSLDSGFEGLMLKVLDSPHVLHRNHKYLMKLKPTKEVTGVIVGTIPGEGANGPARASDVTKAEQTMKQYGQVANDGFYLEVKTKNEAATKELLDKLKALVHDSVERRISTSGNQVSFRHATRLGALMVQADGQEFNVGTGFACKAGNDLRMELWMRRESLAGMKVDFRVQDTNTATVVARHNRFLRLREDL